MLTRIGNEVLVRPLSKITETPVPATLTAVTSVKFAPVIVASNVVPVVPREGDIEVMEGGTRD
jgi:hypothetical protein